MQRRELLRFGLSGLASLSVSDMLRLRAAGAAGGESEPKTALILVWLRGGASHLESFDPKPDAPSDFRGPYNPIDTKTPGLRICELLPRCAKISDRFALLRSMAHDGGGHPAGSLQMLAGDPSPADKLVPEYPDFITVANYLRQRPDRTVPNCVGINGIYRYDNFIIAGPTYLGPSFDQFRITGDPSHPQFSVPNIGLKDAAQLDRVRERTTLLSNFDQLRRDLDASGAMQATDAFGRQALGLLTSPQAARAFDLSLEPDRVRDRYGRHSWGQQCLLARRLVEAGVELITTTFEGPLCGRVQNWDDHAVNQHVFDAMKFRAPPFDQAVTALIEDVYSRGLDQRVMVVVSGEFGRTPRISHVASSGGGDASAPAGVVQPGRDHWPYANSMLFAGGGIRTGQVIGATDRRGEHPIARRVGPQDFLATIYRHLGIDFERVLINNFAGRPTPIVTHGKPIAELTAQVGRRSTWP